MYLLSHILASQGCEAKKPLTYQATVILSAKTVDQRKANQQLCRIGGCQFGHRRMIMDKQQKPDTNDSPEELEAELKEEDIEELAGGAEAAAPPH
jgi:hypothetical protein